MDQETRLSLDETEWNNGYTYKDVSNYYVITLPKLKLFNFIPLSK
jgi:hypothetical protein